MNTEKALTKRSYSVSESDSEDEKAFWEQMGEMERWLKKARSSKKEDDVDVCVGSERLMSCRDCAGEEMRRVNADEVQMLCQSGRLTVVNGAYAKGPDNLADGFIWVPIV